MFTQPPSTAPVPLADGFTDDRGRGKVLGSVAGAGASGGATRGGVDAEGLLAVDGGALRIRPLANPGWGRAALAYGPYHREPGLSVGLLVLNGHHGSEHADPWPSLRGFLSQWLKGTQVDPIPHRLSRRLRHHTRDPLRRRLQAWRGHRAAAGDPHAEDNLALGWLASPHPSTATDGGQGLIVGSAHAENGELRAEASGGPTVVQGRLQNLPLHVVVVLRERGAVYWAATSLEGAAGLPAAPTLRPLLADVTGDTDELWAGVHQRVIGQVGWSIDSRVHGLKVARPQPWTAWWTTAHAADRPADGHPVDAAPTEHGGTWAVAGDVAVLRPDGASGLVRAAFAPGSGPAGLVVRHAGAGDAVLVTIDAGRASVERRVGGGTVLVADADHTSGAGPVDVQVVDDGTTLVVLLDGRRVLGPVEVGPAPVGATGVGVHGGRALVELEAHPLALQPPDDLAFAPLPVPQGTVPVLADDFAALGVVPRADLAGLTSSVGSPWERSVGARAFSVDAGGALVPPAAAVEHHGGKLARVADKLRHASSERLAYTVAWPQPDLADLTTTILAPGTDRDQGEGSRAGLIFWQDPANFLIVNTWLDDGYDGTSVSSFLRLGGYEDVYDAVWTNVGRRITWGVPFELRTAFDGEVHTTWVDGEPVLYRRVTDVYPRASALRINRVGLVANWEFGQDTGSRFVRFEGRS